jgi:hypothetical protein
MPLLLDLFSGTGSVSKIAKELGYDVISLDRDLPADLQTDVMDWDFTQFETGYFDFIWMSPPCTEYSRCLTTRPRDIEGANTITQQALDILEHFVPKHWCIENPQTGLLKEQWFMYGVPYIDVDYCKYGFPYRKRTRLWNNIFNFKPKPLCNKDCNSMNQTRTRHLEMAQRGPSLSRGITTRQTQQQLYSIPPELIREILTAALRDV